MNNESRIGRMRLAALTAVAIALLTAGCATASPDAGDTETPSTPTSGLAGGSAMKFQ
jgi:hypothetical protein